MSSCGIHRHKPGGRLVGNVCVKGSGMKDSELEGKFAEMMASRKAMDQRLESPPTQSPPLTQTLSHQLTVVPKVQATSKKMDIELILQGDMDD